MPTKTSLVTLDSGEDNDSDVGTSDFHSVSSAVSFSKSGRSRSWGDAREGIHHDFQNTKRVSQSSNAPLAKDSPEKLASRKVYNTEALLGKKTKQRETPKKRRARKSGPKLQLQLETPECDESPSKHVQYTKQGEASNSKLSRRSESGAQLENPDSDKRKENSSGESGDEEDENSIDKDSFVSAKGSEKQSSNGDSFFAASDDDSVASSETQLCAMSKANDDVQSCLGAEELAEKRISSISAHELSHVFLHILAKHPDAVVNTLTEEAHHTKRMLRMLIAQDRMVREAIVDFGSMKKVGAHQETFDRYFREPPSPSLGSGSDRSRGKQAKSKTSRLDRHEKKRRETISEMKVSKRSSKKRRKDKLRRKSTSALKETTKQSPRDVVDLTL